MGRPGRQCTTLRSLNTAPIAFTLGPRPSCLARFRLSLARPSVPAKAAPARAAHPTIHTEIDAVRLRAARSQRALPREWHYRGAGALQDPPAPHHRGGSAARRPWPKGADQQRMAKPPRFTARCRARARQTRRRPGRKHRSPARLLCGRRASDGRKTLINSGGRRGFALPAPPTHCALPREGSTDVPAKARTSPARPPRQGHRPAARPRRRWATTG